jgi:hypothetical protein
VPVCGADGAALRCGTGQRSSACTSRGNRAAAGEALRGGGEKRAARARSCHGGRRRPRPAWGAYKDLRPHIRRLPPPHPPRPDPRLPRPPPLSRSRCEARPDRQRPGHRQGTARSARCTPLRTPVPAPPRPLRARRPGARCGAAAMRERRPYSIVTGANSGIGARRAPPPPAARRRLQPTAAASHSPAAGRWNAPLPPPFTPSAAPPTTPPHKTGREVAAGLMARGHHVVLACRNGSACDAAAVALAAAHPQGSCECSLCARGEVAARGGPRHNAQRLRFPRPQPPLQQPLGSCPSTPLICAPPPPHLDPRLPPKGRPGGLGLGARLRRAPPRGAAAGAAPPRRPGQ